MFKHDKVFLKYVFNYTVSNYNFKEKYLTMDDSTITKVGNKLATIQWMHNNKSGADLKVEQNVGYR